MFAAPVILILVACGHRQSPAKPLDRAAFVRRLITLDFGDTISTVEKVLGKPDVIFSGEHQDPFGPSGADQTWVYGAVGKQHTATLAYLIFDRRGALQGGDRSRPFEWPKVDESHIRRSIELWRSRWPIFSFIPSNNDVPEPLAAIRLANLLRPMGKDATLAGLDEFCAIYYEQAAELMSFHQSVLRLLFDVNPARAKSSRDLRVRIALEFDSGFVLSGIAMPGGGFAAGTGVPPTAHEVIPLYRVLGVLRRTPVTPTSDLLNWPQRAEHLGLLASNQEWLARKVICDLLSSVQRNFQEDERDTDRSWREATKVLTKQTVKWDPTLQIFMTSQGKYETRFEQRLPVIKCWRPSGTDRLFVFTRTSLDRVLVSCESLSPRAKDIRAALDVQAPSGAARHLSGRHLGGLGDIQVWSFPVQNGSRFRITDDGKPLDSPWFDVSYPSSASTTVRAGRL